MKLRYSKIKSVDGDTIRIKWRGLAWYVRIVGLDTDELNGPKHNRAIKQQAILDSYLSKWIKPRVIAEVGETREGWPVIKHHNGRFLCRVLVWSWRRLWFVDYAKLMVNNGNVKRGSKWNQKT
jgi:endonuclease YncB( thermonuclease family)